MQAIIHDVGGGDYCDSRYDYYEDRDKLEAACRGYVAGVAMAYASAELKADREFVMAAAKQWGGNLGGHSNKREGPLPNFSADREILLVAAQTWGLVLARAAPELKADREIVLAAVQQEGSAIEHACEELRADREIVLAALRAPNYASDEPHDLLQYAADELKADREVVMAAVHAFGDALQHAADELKADREVVLEAVEQNPNALRYASNREAVLTAVQQNGKALEIVSETLRADREVVMAAVQQSGWVLKYASKELKADREVVLATVQQVGRALEYASKELKADPEVVMAAVQQDGRALEYASKELKADREVVMAVVRQRGWALVYASEELRADREVVLAAVRNDPNALEHVTDPELVKEVAILLVKEYKKQSAAPSQSGSLIGLGVRSLGVRSRNAAVKQSCKEIMVGTWQSGEATVTFGEEVFSWITAREVPGVGFVSLKLKTSSISSAIFDKRSNVLKIRGVVEVPLDALNRWYDPLSNVGSPKGYLCLGFKTYHDFLEVLKAIPRLKARTNFQNGKLGGT